MNEKEFDITKYLDEEILNFINQKEEERRKTQQFLIILTAIFVIIIILFLSMSGNTKSDDILIILVVMVIWLIICYSGLMKIFYEGFKENIIKNLIEALKINISYYPEKSLDKEDFIGCDLFEEPDYFSANELYLGKIDKTEIKFGYVNAQVEEKDYSDANGQFYDYDYVYDDDDYIYHPQNTGITHSKTVTIFNGYLYCVDFNKKISGTTKLYPKSFINLTQGLLFENPEFMSYFNVRSTDEIEARYILSLSMLERIVNLRKKYGKFYMSFKNDSLYLAYPSSNINLNFSFFKPILSEDNPLIGYLTVLNLAMDIVNGLDLNTRIWTKD